MEGRKERVGSLTRGHVLLMGGSMEMEAFRFARAFVTPGYYSAWTKEYPRPTRPLKAHDLASENRLARIPPPSSRPTPFPQEA